MQPPRQIRATVAMSTLQPYSSLAERICSRPCAYATTLLAHRAPRTSSLSRARSATSRRRSGPAARRASPRVPGVAGGGAGEDGLGDGRHGNAELECGLDRPASCPLLLGRVDDDVDEGKPGRSVHVVEDLGRELDEERVELTGVPLAEDVGDLRGSHPGAARSTS